MAELVDELKQLADSELFDLHPSGEALLRQAIAALKDRDRLRAVLAAAREMSALDIDYLMRNRQAAFDAADKLQDAIDVYDVAALEGRDG